MATFFADKQRCQKKKNRTLEKDCLENIPIWEPKSLIFLVPKSYRIQPDAFSPKRRNRKNVSIFSHKHPVKLGSDRVCVTVIVSLGMVVSIRPYIDTQSILRCIPLRRL